jgi:hypothetical protein
MLSWEKRFRGSPGQISWTTKTALGTAIIHEQAGPEGTCIMDMWRPDQSPIGRGVFPNADAAKTRAESVLDPRGTWHDLIDQPLFEDRAG